MIRSIGEILKRARERNKLTLEDAYRDTKIHPNYIKALEADNYGAFAGKVHSKGFLKIYSEYLGLNVDDILALWRREYAHEFDAIEKKQLLPKKFIDVPKIVVTPSSLVATLSFVFLIVFFGYLYYQYRGFTGAPALTVTYPPDNLLIQTDILDITGKTDLDSEIFINGQKIILNPDGSFADSVRLKEGLNTLSIKAVNKLEKQTEYIKTVIYRPEKKEPPVDVPSETTQSTPAVTF